MKIENNEGCDQRPRVILFILVQAAVGLSLNCHRNDREQNPSAAAYGRSPVTVQSTPKKNDSPTDDHSAFCKDEKARVQSGLREIFRDFQRSDSPKAIEVLAALDSRIRALLNSRPCEDASAICDPQWEEIGVSLGYWRNLAYSGMLLEDAHDRNPNSPLRGYTLFSTIFGTKPYHGLGVMPDINAAFIYASEFPNGPFAKQTFRVIADFHKDLFMVLRDNKRDYTHDCYRPFINEKPIATQKERAKRIALKYYRKALEIDLSNEELKTFLNDVENETVKAWSFCAD